MIGYNIKYIASYVSKDMFRCSYNEQLCLQLYFAKQFTSYSYIYTHVLAICIQLQ